MKTVTVGETSGAGADVSITVTVDQGAKDMILTVAPGTGVTVNPMGTSTVTSYTREGNTYTIANPENGKTLVLQAEGSDLVTRTYTITIQVGSTGMGG